ncbi:uncharacterized protein L3040_000917 [Drepanopeziza brunnea f. sp. 'multigermtubi']|uniref:uncharacterized protein n=1 Tax=Drepanopeziza brunnea f. sp. 'multigermtubi' TaxID=698441 RepID=UPI00239F2B9E|nr:hypothetical protein L3040_000917 [Drepanopeziza brunnea f. sp. 'multigermtubi']
MRRSGACRASPLPERAPGFCKTQRPLSPPHEVRGLWRWHFFPSGTPKQRNGVGKPRRLGRDQGDLYPPTLRSGEEAYRSYRASLMGAGQHCVLSVPGIFMRNEVRGDVWLPPKLTSRSSRRDPKEGHDMNYGLTTGNLILDSAVPCKAAPDVETSS